MKRKRTPRVHSNPIGIAINAVSKLTPAEHAGLQGTASTALDCIRRGTDGRVAWARLADMLNVSEALADIGICSDEGSRGRILAGFGALEALIDRHEARGTWTATGPELVALDEALWLHGVQLAHVSVGELTRAVERIKARIAQVRAQRPKGVVVRELTE